MGRPQPKHSRALLRYEPVDLVCRLRHSQLRAWKKNSLRSDVCVAGRIRPQAYSSWSTAFRSYLNELDGDSPSATLWIATSLKLPGRGRLLPSLAARIEVPSPSKSRDRDSEVNPRRYVFKGSDDDLPGELSRYVFDWAGKGNARDPRFCTVAKAHPVGSRFFPVNDFSCCVDRVRYVNRDGSDAAYSPRRIMRVHPESVHDLRKHEADISTRTVFISYKHDDLKPSSNIERPEWTPEQLAAFLVSSGYGVWMDTLCAPSRISDSRADLSHENVRLLLAEGLAQSQILIAIDTQGYRTVGTNRTNWTENEYTDRVVDLPRERPLRRMVLHGVTHRDLNPRPHEVLNWSVNLDDRLIKKLESLLSEADLTQCEAPQT